MAGLKPVDSSRAFAPSNRVECTVSCGLCSADRSLFPSSPHRAGPVPFLPLSNPSAACGSLNRLPRTRRAFQRPFPVTCSAASSGLHLFEFFICTSRRELHKFFAFLPPKGLFSGDAYALPQKTLISFVRNPTRSSHSNKKGSR